MAVPVRAGKNRAVQPGQGRPRSRPPSLQARPHQGALVALVALVSLFGLLALVLLPGWNAAAAAAPPKPVVAVAKDGALRVTVTATGSGTSAVVHYAVTATDADARGALGYDVEFGDGTGTSDAVPQFCTATGTARHALWHLAHRYAAGTYRVAVSVRANCSAAAATARLTVRAV